MRSNKKWEMKEKFKEVAFKNKGDRKVIIVTIFAVNLNKI